MYPREAIKTLKNIGDVENQYFNHNKEMNEIKQLVDKNIKELKPIAEPYKILSYARIYGIDDIKSCIIKDTPVPISIPVYGDIELDENNIIQITNKSISGYHMILVYGWNEYGFLIQNSWGKDWGNNGTAILPYEYPIDSAWAISTNKNNLNIKTSFWQKLYKWLQYIIEQLKIIFIGEWED